jgi:hypothetical protein
MASSLLRGTGWGAAGAVVAVVASIWHRARVGGAAFPLGLVLACLAVVGVAVAARALGGWAGVVGAAVGVFAAAQAVALRGPGGDILVQGDTWGFLWIAGAPVLALVAVLLPRRWFKRRRPKPLP